MEELTPLLKELASQMNTTVEFLWSVMVRQAWVFAISYIIGILFLFILTTITMKYTKWAANNIDWDSTEVAGTDIAKFLLTIVLWGVVTVISVVSVINFTTFLTALLNPEYWALQQILEYIK